MYRHRYIELYVLTIGPQCVDTAIGLYVLTIMSSVCRHRYIKLYVLIIGSECVETAV